MSKKVIRLTEAQLREIVAESINAIINESNIVMPALADTVTSKTDDSIINGEYHIDMNGKQVEPNQQNNRAKVLRNQLLTHYILQEIGEIHLVFLKQDREVGKPVSVSFDMQNVKECNENRVVLRGVMRVPTNFKIVDKNADVSLDNATKKFTCITYENGSRKKDNLILPVNGELNQSNYATYKRLVLLIEDFLNVCDVCTNEMGKMESPKEYYDAITKKMNSRYKRQITN